MSSMPSNVHSPSACSTAHAITYVPTLPLHPIHSLTRRKPDTGDRPYKCQYCGDQFARRYASLHFPLSNHLIPWLLATFSLATSINATPTRSLSQTASPAVAEKALLPHLARPHPSRPVTSVSSPVFHVMGPTLAVRTPPLSTIIRSSLSVLSPYLDSSPLRNLQQNAFPASVAVRMSNFTGKLLRAVPVIILPAPLPLLRPRSVSGLRGYRLIIWMVSSLRHLRPCHLLAPPPSLVQTRSSIPHLPLTLLLLLTLQIGRPQTCPSCPFPWHPMQTWLQNTGHRPNSFDVLVLRYFPITQPRCCRICMPPSNTSHHRVTGTLPGVNLELTPPWMIPSHLTA